MKLHLFNILWFIGWFLFWIVVIASFIYIYWFMETLLEHQKWQKEILSILKHPVSCELPYWLQDKIEETYKNVVSFECETNP